jgi:hypothetical protein
MQGLPLTAPGGVKYNGKNMPCRKLGGPIFVLLVYLLYEEMRMKRLLPP